MGWSYRMHNFSTKSTLVIAYHFFCHDKDNDAPHLPSPERVLEAHALLSFQLVSDTSQLIYESGGPLGLGGTKTFIASVTEAGECDASLVLSADGSAEVWSDKIFIPPTVEHTISVYYFEY